MSSQRRAFIAWNVDGLRALLRSAGGVAALRRLLVGRPALLCLLEHKLQVRGFPPPPFSLPEVACVCMRARARVCAALPKLPRTLDVPIRWCRRSSSPPAA